MINKSQSMDAPRIYMELELLDNCGHSVTLANPREVEVVDAEMFAAAVKAKNAQDGGTAIEHPAAEAAEEREVDAVGDDVGGERAVEVEPLGALAPLPGGHDGAHPAAVAAAARGARLVVRLEVHLGGVDEVRVHRREVEQRHVRLR